MLRRRLRWSLLGFALLAGVSTHAADRPFGDLAWRFIGPFRGGRVLAVAGAPDDPQHFYFGSVNGGVWETRDAGRTWSPIFDDAGVGSIGALALAPSDPKTIYVGSGEADMRSDIAQGDGMYVTRDGGKTWKRIGLTDSQQIAHIVVHPADASLVYVAALGHPYGPNAERGVFRTRDGGTSWQKILGPDDNTGAIDVLFEPGNPSVLYAALWQTRRPPWNVYPASSGPGSGIYKSTDGGDHWTKLSSGLPAAFGRVGLDISPAAPQRVYALVDAESGGGLYRSDNGGETWTKASGDPRIWGRGWYFGRITVDPKQPDRVWSLNTIVLRSEDGGKTFVPQRGDPTGDDFHELWIDPANTKRQILGTDQGTLVTLNGGATWSSWYNQPTAQFYHVATDNRFPYFVYGAQQDSGAAGVPSRTVRGDGITMTNFREIAPGGENDNIAPDPKDPQIVFGGRVDKLDLRTNQTRNVSPTLAFPDFHRATWTLPLVFSRRDPRVLYSAHQNLYRTDDGGDHWTQISPDLTREDPGTPSNLDAPTAALTDVKGPRRGVIYAISPSPLADKDLWAGTDDGLVWRTRDEGAHWENVTPPALTPWSKVGVIEASPHDAHTAYIAVDRHRLDDFRPYVYRTRDDGKSWTLVASGITATEPVNVVREDPVRPGLLYAGTERGVWISFDAGDSWEPLQINLPHTSVRDIEVKGVDLVIATHGRGFWILDDVTALRQMDAKPAARLAQTRLFTPARAVRLRPEPFVGTPFPKEEPAAPNPPIGAYVDYVLASAASSPVTLTIKDSQGQEVRKYSSADTLPPVDLARLRSAPEWLPKPVTLAATPGLHRFVWPVRYGAPRPLARDAFTDGVWAPPGRYVVELTVDGRTLSAPLEVVPDPRVTIPAAAYGEEFALAKRIEGVRVKVAEASAAAQKLQASIVERRSSATGDLRAALDAFEMQLAVVTGGSGSPFGPSTGPTPPPSLTSFRSVSSSLNELLQAVDDADAAPSADARAGFTKAEGAAGQALAAWDALQQRDLPAMNARLTAAGLKALSQ